MSGAHSLLRHIAIHIAGLAVANVRLGLGTYEVRINTRDGALGQTADKHLVVGDADRAATATIAFCSGYAALIAAGYRELAAVFVAWDNLDRARNVAEYWHIPGDIDDWKLRALELMQRPENVAAVALVARHLMERRQLDGDAVARLVERASAGVD
jgi:hypothetical protein